VQNKFQTMLLLTVNNSIGNIKNHFTVESLCQLFNKTDKFSNHEKYALDIIKTEATQEELEWFSNEYNITLSKIEYILSLDIPYEKIPSKSLKVVIHESKKLESTFNDNIIEFFQSSPIMDEINIQRETEVYEDKKSVFLEADDEKEILAILKDDTFSSQDEFKKEFNL